MNCPATGIILPYLTQGLKPILCELLRASHGIALIYWQRVEPQCPLAAYLHGMRAGLETRGVFCFRAVFSCWLQSLFA